MRYESPKEESVESGEIVGADDDAFQGTAASRPAPGRPAAEENAERIASGALATSRSAKGAASCDYDVEIPERSTKKPRKGEWDGQHADPEGTEKEGEGLVVDAGDGMTGDMVSAILSPAAVHRDGGRSGVGGMRAVDGHAGVAAGGADSADESKRKRAIQALKDMEMLWRSVRQPSPDRKWVPCPRPTDDLCQTDVSPGQAHVTVVTWRLLTHDAVLRFCSGVVPPYLRVDARTASVVSDLRHWAADIILLQDVEAVAFGVLERPLAGLGYSGIRVGSSGPGQAVFFKKSEYTLLHVRGCVASAVLGRTPAQVSKGRPVEPGEEDAVHHASLWEELREHDMTAPFATVAVLRRRSTGKPLCVCSAQLSPRGMHPEIAAVHADLLCWTAQAACQGLLTEAECEDLPVVIGGDLCMPALIYRTHKFYNVAPGAPPLRPGVRELLLRREEPLRRQPADRQRTTGMTSTGLDREEQPLRLARRSGTLPESHIDHPNVRKREALLPHLHSHGLGLFSAWAAADGGEEPCLTAMGPTASAAIALGHAPLANVGALCASVDAILATKKHFAVTRVLELPFSLPQHDEGAARDPARDPSVMPVLGLEPMPGPRWPSGHIAIGIDLALR